ncbi:hypothetical protein ACJX0J_006964, partial [Zea mays]
MTGTIQLKFIAKEYYPLADRDLKEQITIARNFLITIGNYTHIEYQHNPNELYDGELKMIQQIHELSIYPV